MPEEETIQYKMLLPVSVKDRIEAAAARERRSLSGQIIHTLEQAYPAPSATDFSDMLVRLFEGLNAVADQGDQARLEREIHFANAKLDAAGHGRIRFSYLLRNGCLLVRAENRLASRNRETDEPARLGFTDLVHKS